MNRSCLGVLSPTQKKSGLHVATVLLTCFLSGIEAPDQRGECS
jgi:hypothetical protein